MRRHILMLSTLVVPFALIACGSSSGNTGGTGGTGSGTGGTTTATGTGGSGSGTGGSTTGTGGSGTSSSSTGTGTGTGTGGAAPMNQCTDTADATIIQTQDVQTVATHCGTSNFATQDKIQQCIIDGTKGDGGTGLSQGCSGCFADEVKCVIMNCVSQCLADSTSAACTSCRAQNCDPAFYSCSGLPQQGG